MLVTTPAVIDAVAVAKVVPIPTGDEIDTEGAVVYPTPPPIILIDVIEPPTETIADAAAPTNSS